MSVSPEELKVRTERLFEEVWNNHDLSLIEEFIALEYILSDSQPPIKGRMGLDNL